MFLNRVDELGQLRARFDGQDAELLVVYGRRRIGKTELLTHLAADVRSLYVEATDSVPADQLRDLGAELAPFIGARAPHRFVFSRSGFDRELTARAAQDPKVTLVSPTDIYV